MHGIFYDWKHNFLPFGRGCAIKSWEVKNPKNNDNLLVVCDVLLVVLAVLAVPPHHCCYTRPHSGLYGTCQGKDGISQ